MGRIKTKLVKRLGEEAFELHEDKFSDDFEHNKKTLNKLISATSKKNRNTIAGYVTRRVKNKEVI